MVFLRPDNSKRRGQRLQTLKQSDEMVYEATSKRRLIFNAVKLAFFLCMSVLAYVFVAVLLDLHRVPDLSFLDNYQPVADIQIFDCNDHLIANIEGAEKRKIIPLSDITPHMQRAVLTAEDHHFYEHHGIDFLGILRATVVNLVKRHAVQGGSTITQQLAKNLFFEDCKRTLTVKVAEAIVSQQLENRFSKEKILELYLNEVYFGNGAYGIEQAANIYFDKSAAQLTIAESAYIAGLIRYPSRGGQAAYRRENRERQQDVLDKMHDNCYITDYQWKQAKEQTLVFKTRPPQKLTCPIPRYQYYISYVLELVRGMYREGEIERHGLKVYTNLDPLAQDAAEHALAQGVHHGPAGLNQGALVSINVRDSAVVAMVGGVGNYLDNQWNCATNPHTTGSAFKPFVYLTAFNKGLLEPSSLIDDSPLEIKQSHGPDYKPKNYDGKYMGAITVAEALAYSRNTCAVRVASEVGIPAIIETARLAGIQSRLDPQISLALGCSAASPLEMAAAYATFARGGEAMRPIIIRRVENRHQDILKSYYPASDRVFETTPVAKLVDVLQEVVVQGTAQQAKLTDRPVAGKTGTADQAKDLWFVGFTPDLVTAVWGGNSDNKPIPGSHVTGGTVMARIWRDYNKVYYAQHNVPTGWFIACTHLAAGNTFAVRTAKKKIEPPKAAAPVLQYEQSPYAGGAGYETPRRAPVRRATARSGAGVTEYRWSR
jgi:1A family penicillin-binding protein